MTFVSEFKENIFEINNKTFESYALKVFAYQAEHCDVYKEYLQLLNTNVGKIENITQIPFLPIDFFKSKLITSTHKEYNKFFLSSGTTSMDRSKHVLYDSEFYKKVSQYIFENRFSSLSEYIVVGYLPSYMKNPHSSLIQMMNYFFDISGDKRSKFYTKNELKSLLKSESEKNILLFGVTYALMDLDIDCSKNNITVIDTGGMKGRKKEIIKSEAINTIQQNLNIDKMFSEYGMTELMSQCYSNTEGQFYSPEWFKVLLRDPNDPFELNKSKGAMNIIELANIDTCAFIETKDLGQFVPEQNLFEVLGRMDNSDLRGCSLMTI